jgi:predicted XRE-type DNA-binding protein
MTNRKFTSVWDAIEDDPVKREIYKLRSELIHVITQYIRANELKQREVASLLGISQPRVSTRVISAGYVGWLRFEVWSYRQYRRRVITLGLQFLTHLEASGGHADQGRPRINRVCPSCRAA